MSCWAAATTKRPLVANAAGRLGRSNVGYRFIRDAQRFTLTGKVRPKAAGGNEFLSRVGGNTVGISHE